MACYNCGGEVDDRYRYCSWCGSPQTPQSEPDAPDSGCHCGCQNWKGAARDPPRHGNKRRLRLSRKLQPQRLPRPLHQPSAESHPQRQR